jgi:hypothetical protein
MTTQSTGCDREVDGARLAALGFASTLWLVAIVLLCRAAGGAVREAPPPIVACCLSALSFAIGLCAWQLDMRRNRTAAVRDLIASGLGGIAAPLIIGLTLAGGSALVIGLTIALAFLSAAWVLAATALPGDAMDVESDVTPEAGGMLGELPLVAQTRETEVPEEAEPPANGACGDDRGPECALDDPEVSQQIVRRMGVDAGESIEALLRVPFRSGERESVMHLPIHPPLSAPPQVECEPLDDADVSIQVTAARRFGVRIEVRRPPPCELPAEVAVGVTIRVDGAAEAAA